MAALVAAVRSAGHRRRGRTPRGSRSRGHRRVASELNRTVQRPGAGKPSGQVVDRPVRRSSRRRRCRRAVRRPSSGASPAPWLAWSARRIATFGPRRPRVAPSRSRRRRDEVAVQVEDAPVRVLAFSQSSGTVSSNKPSSSSSWPWNSIGMPGDVRTSADPSIDALLRPPVVGVAGRDRLGDADLAVGDLVVRLGVDDPAQRLARGPRRRSRRRRHRCPGPRRRRPRARGRTRRMNPASHCAPNPAPPVGGRR